MVLTAAVLAAEEIMAVSAAFAQPAATAPSVAVAASPADMAEVEPAVAPAAEPRAPEAKPAVK